MKNLFCRKQALGAMALMLALLVLTPMVVAGADSDASDTTIELNGATVDELKALPGVGKVIADRIVAWRDEHGPFRSVDDLLKVKGIGERSFQRLRPHVVVDRQSE